MPPLGFSLSWSWWLSCLRWYGLSVIFDCTLVVVAVVFVVLSPSSIKQQQPERKREGGSEGKSRSIFRRSSKKWPRGTFSKVADIT